jgi:putative transposase
MTPRGPLYAGYRYPTALISYAVWLYFRFPVSLHMVEEMLAAHCISVTYDDPAVRFEIWPGIRQPDPSTGPTRGDKWHLDEVVLPIPGKRHWLWRAVDQLGFDFLVRSWRDKKAAKRFCHKLLKKQAQAPRVLIVDKLRSYAGAKREIMRSV